MHSNKNGIVYNGSYMNEGHEVTFIILTDNRAKIIECFRSGASASTNEKYQSLDQAIEYQDKLIKLGYDKVS